MPGTLKKFLIRAALLTAAWLLLYHFYLRKNTKLDRQLCHVVVSHSTSFLSLFDTDYHVSFQPRGKYRLYTVCYADKCLVGVGRPCNGLELFVLFAGFIIAFPGNSRNKLWFIPAGILLIHFVNVLRVAALAVIQLNWHSWLEFNHKYTFTVLVYMLIFCLWMLWMNRFSKTKADE
jgi:exosortase family protein XrtF